MRLCCNDTGMSITNSLTENEPKMKRLHDIGFRVIGIHGVNNASEDDILRFKDLSAKYDMKIAMSPNGAQPAHPDLSKRREEHERLRKTLKNMQKLDGDLIHITGGSYDGSGWWHHPKNFTQEGLDDLIGEMKKVAPYAEDTGISVCPETTQWCILNSPERMKEYIDRVDSEYIKVTFDLTNHMRPDRIYESGRFIRCVIDMLGEGIGQLHVKDVQIKSGLVIHIDEAPMGTGLLDHEAVIKASDDLEPWKTFSLEHFNDPTVDSMIQRERAYKHIQSVAQKIGHTWTNPNCTRKKWQNGEYR
ncbi:sugar phosphate isomerase/epimerase family protein [Candidatus Latescibacterota bacterium]